MCREKIKGLEDNNELEVVRIPGVKNDAHRKLFKLCSKFYQDPAIKKHFSDPQNRGVTPDKFRDSKFASALEGALSRDGSLRETYCLSKRHTPDELARLRRGNGNNDNSNSSDSSDSSDKEGEGEREKERNRRKEEEQKKRGEKKRKPDDLSKRKQVNKAGREGEREKETSREGKEGQRQRQRQPRAPQEAPK